jgi:hypothetical protein
MMTLQTRIARPEAPAIAAMVAEADVQDQIDRELAMIAKLVGPSEDAAPTDDARLAALTGLVGRWQARRALRRMPLAA